MEFPGLGAPCSLSTCRRLDFLPVRCSACHKDFCADHYAFASHNCVLGRSNDVQAPVCPVCDCPVALRRPAGGVPESADAAVCRHWDRSECSKARPKKKSKGCIVHKCKKNELVPITCDKCHSNVCLTHRHPLDHDCARRQESRKQDTRQLRLLHQQRQQQQAQRVQSGSSKLRDIQGEMSEDEALARALQLSVNTAAASSAAVNQQRDRQNEPKACLVS